MRNLSVSDQYCKSLVSLLNNLSTPWQMCVGGGLACAYDTWNCLSDILLLTNEGIVPRAIPKHLPHTHPISVVIANPVIPVLGHARRYEISVRATGIWIIYFLRLFVFFLYDLRNKHKNVFVYLCQVKKTYLDFRSASHAQSVIDTYVMCD